MCGVVLTVRLMPRPDAAGGGRAVDLPAPARRLRHPDPDAHRQERGAAVAGDGDAAIVATEVAGDQRADLAIVLDDQDVRLSICRRLRAASGIPILMLTAKSEEIDRIVGLETVAGDGDAAIVATEVAGDQRADLAIVLDDQDVRCTGCRSAGACAPPPASRS
jgi:CheY-like chemotaxis protein